MGIADVIEQLQDPQLNYVGIKSAVEPLMYEIPHFVGDFYCNLDCSANTQGAILALEKIQQDYENAPWQAKLWNSIKAGFLVWGKYHQAYAASRIM